MKINSSLTDQLVGKCDSLLQENIKDPKKVELYTTIKNILTSPVGIANNDCELMLNILLDLKYTKDQALNIIKQILKG